MKIIAGKYEIMETIATGGMATIYKARQISLDREVVVKKLHPHLAEDANFVRRFKREAAILAKLQHKNIVGILDFFEENNEQYIVLEYIRGYSLDRLIKERKAIPFGIAVYILREVCRGLSYIHINNILHRDLKPDNIMISDDGDIKITDFGLAYRKENMNITNPGTYVGTPSYFPPEQLMGRPLTPAADIFSLAVLFVEMLTGKNPFEGDKEFDTINNILYHTKVKLKFHGARPPSQIIKLIYAMMEKDPQNRISSCDDIIKILNAHTPPLTRDTFDDYLNNRRSLKHEDINLTVSISTRRDAYYLIALFALMAVFTVVSAYQIYNYIQHSGNRYKEVIVEVPKEGYVLHIESEPNRADVSINDSLFLKTPVSINLVPDTYWIRTADERFKQRDTVIALFANDTLIMNLTEKEIIYTYGYLKINVMPWADLYIDNEFIDRTPLEDSVKLTTGTHNIRLVHPNRKILEEEVNIKEGTITLDRELEKAFGFLKIIVKPWGNVFIDDSLVGITPLADTIKLTTGPHRVIIKNPALGEMTDNINIIEKEVLRKYYSF